MHGFPLDISKKLMRISSAISADRYFTCCCSLVDRCPCDQSLRQPLKYCQAVQLIERQRGVAALIATGIAACAGIAEDKGIREHRNCYRWLCGVETEAFDLIRKNLGEANMFTFGIGRGEPSSP
jgi:Ca-activated chloride channel family protein